MKYLEGHKVGLSKLAYYVPWIGVLVLTGCILYLNIPVVSLSSRGCTGTDCSVGMSSVKNTQEEWKEGKFVESSEVLHVKKQGLEFSFLNPPAAQHLSITLEWIGESKSEPLLIRLASNKDFTQDVQTVTPAITSLKDSWDLVSGQFELPDVATRKWFVAVEGSQGKEVRLLEVNTLSDPSLLAKLHSWWQNTHN